MNHISIFGQNSPSPSPEAVLGKRLHTKDLLWEGLIWNESRRLENHAAGKEDKQKKSIYSLHHYHQENLELSPTATC
jgi:hypothetical protein